jgi:hypothetical protein
MDAEVGMTSHDIDYPNLSKLPMTSKGRYISSFCLGCKDSNISAKGIVHECAKDKFGIVLLIQKKFDTSSGSSLADAQEAVNKTILSLRINKDGCLTEKRGEYQRGKEYLVEEEILNQSPSSRSLDS